MARAREDLARALARVKEDDRLLSKDPSLWDDWPWPWLLRIQWQVLRREAEATILDAAFPADPFAR